MPHKTLQTFTQQLDEAAHEETRNWFEAYTKQQEQYRGVKTPEVERILTNFLHDHPHLDLEAFATRLLYSDYIEDRLAGMIVYQKVLIPNDHMTHEKVLAVCENLFKDGVVTWWNTCDWLCMRVLAPLLLRERTVIAPTLRAWSNASNVWQRRSSLVPYIKYAKAPEALYDTCREDLLTNASRVITSPERFDQTAVGWLLREVGKTDPATLHTFVHQNIQHFSAEGLRYATEKLTRKEQLQYRDARKKAMATGGGL
jgi:3-methyladenine DNA glycosylase AlkD